MGMISAFLIWLFLASEILWHIVYVIYVNRYKKADKDFYKEDKKHLQFVYVFGTFVVVPLIVLLFPAMIILLMILNNERVSIFQTLNDL